MTITVLGTGAATEKASTSYFEVTISPSADPSGADGLLVISVATDNVNATTPTVTGVTVDGVSRTFKQSNSGAISATAGAATIAHMVVAQAPYAAASSVVGITLSNAVTAKAARAALVGGADYAASAVVTSGTRNGTYTQSSMPTGTTYRFVTVAHEGNSTSIPALASSPVYNTTGGSGVTNVSMTQAWFTSASGSATTGTLVDGGYVVYDVVEGAPATFSTFKVWNGSTWVSAPLKRWDGSAWVDQIAKRYNGSTWENVP